MAGFDAAVPVASIALPDEQRLVYVGFKRRLGARLIDTAIHYALSFGVGIFAAVVILAREAITGVAAAPALQRMSETSGWAFLFSLIGTVLYDSVCEGFFGSTAGKHALGMVVLNEDETPCTFKAAVGRSLAFFFDSLLFGLVADIAMKSSPKLQRYGDKWFKTVVVTRASAPAGSLRSPLRFVGVLLAALLLDAIALTAGILI